MYYSRQTHHARRRRIAGGTVSIVLLMLLGLVWTHANVKAAPPAGVKCRGLYQCQKAVAWQKRQRIKRLATYYRPRVALALQIASALYGVPLHEMTTVASCETGGTFDPNAKNGQFLGLFQLGKAHRNDRIVGLLGWRNPLAEALHTAHYVTLHGWGEWQCRPDGGLRW